MNINIKAKNLDLTPPLEIYLNKKVESLDKMLSQWEKTGSVEIDFEISRSTRHHRKGDVFYAEANLHINGVMLRANSDGNDIREAIDLVKDKLKMEILKYKEKHA